MAFHISLGLSCLNRSPFDDIGNGSKATLRKPKNIPIYLSHKTSEVVKSAIDCRYLKRVYWRHYQFQLFIFYNVKIFFSTTSECALFTEGSTTQHETEILLLKL